MLDSKLVLIPREKSSALQDIFCIIKLMKFKKSKTVLLLH
jgi:hypothetical protein